MSVSWRHACQAVQVKSDHADVLVLARAFDRRENLSQLDLLLASTGDKQFLQRVDMRARLDNDAVGVYDQGAILGHGNAAAGLQ